MPSPFPGMNPYLEHPDVWPDFHGCFLQFARQSLVAQLLRRGYYVKSEEQVYIHELPPDQWRPLGRADVAVSTPTSPQADGGTAEFIEAPHECCLVETVDTIASTYLEIRDRSNDAVVTIVELLSPSNKRPGPDRNQFALKRLRITRSSTNYVELDLLRDHPRHEFATALPPCSYYAMVSRFSRWPRTGVWPFGLRDRLATIAVPLRGGEPDASLDLQECLHQAYDAAGYGGYVYRNLPSPPLSSADAAWAAQFVPHGEGA